MIDNSVWFITRADRGLGLDIARDEPSHIHLPRRRRVMRPDDQAASAPWPAHISDDEYRRHAQPASQPRQNGRGEDC